MQERPCCPLVVPTYGEPIEELNKIKIVDNGEPLVQVLKHCPGITFAAEHPKFPGSPRTCWVRRTVADMLCEAHSYLPEGIHLEIQDAWRSPVSQMELWRLLTEELKLKNPDWAEDVLIEHANQFVANPFIRVPPPHTTGGAVDITLMNVDGQMLDMSSPYGWSETAVPTNYPGISAEARRNRGILKTVMSKAGFSNYLGEWWHWSYGDSAWALRAGLDIAIYGPAEGPPAEMVDG